MRPRDLGHTGSHHRASVSPSVTDRASRGGGRRGAGGETPGLQVPEPPGPAPPRPPRAPPAPLPAERPRGEGRRGECGCAPACGRLRSTCWRCGVRRVSTRGAGPGRAPGTGTRGQKRETRRSWAGRSPPRDGQARCVHLALPPGPEEGRGRQCLKRRMRPLWFFHVFILRPLSFCVTDLSARRVAPRAHVSPTSA